MNYLSQFLHIGDTTQGISWDILLSKVNIGFPGLALWISVARTMFYMLLVDHVTYQHNDNSPRLLEAVVMKIESCNGNLEQFTSLFSPVASTSGAPVADSALELMMESEFCIIYRRCCHGDYRAHVFQ